MKSTIAIASIIAALLFGYGAGSESGKRRIAPPKVIHTTNGDFPVTVELLPCDLDECYAGMTYFAQRRIGIAPGECLDEEQDTVFHEALHAEMGEEFSDKQLNGHEAIGYLSKASQRLLANNPDLVRYLSQ